MLIRYPPQIVAFMNSSPQHKLDYATPRAGRARINRTRSRILGLIAGLFAVPALFLGFRGIVWGLSGRFEFAWDLDTYVLLAIAALGCLSAYLSFRLLRAADGG
jgi:hypothetical protein